MSQLRPVAFVASILLGCAAHDEPLGASNDALAAADVGTNPGEIGTDPGQTYLVDPTPVGATELLGLAEIFVPTRGFCSAVLIADDRVLTAGHCACTFNDVGGNVCQPRAQVTFRQPPSGPPLSAEARTIWGNITVHPDYNPSWLDSEVENDLAVIALDSPAAAYVTRMSVSVTPASGWVKMVGFGRSGAGCATQGGTLNAAWAQIQGYGDNGKIAEIAGSVTCPGDSGGPLTNQAGDTVFAILSGEAHLVGGTITKYPSTHAYYSWIKGLTCPSDFWNQCSGKGPICQCRAGLADCDTNRDCQSGLACAQNVGATFGYSSDADVCVPASGPIQGTCGCGNSGLANVCTAAYNQCSAGFAPVCSPARAGKGSYCGGCSCQ